MGFFWEISSWENLQRSNYSIPNRLLFFIANHLYSIFLLWSKKRVKRLMKTVGCFLLVQIYCRFCCFLPIFKFWQRRKRVFWLMNILALSRTDDRWQSSRRQDHQLLCGVVWWDFDINFENCLVGPWTINKKT